MALGVKYIFDWLDGVTGDAWNYDILEEGHTAEPIEFGIAGGSPLRITTEGRDTQKLQPGIHGTEAKLSLRTEDGVRMAEFITENPKRFRLDVYRNGDLVFTGFAKPFLYDEPLKDGNYPFELSFTDGLGDLSRLKIKKDGYVPSKPIDAVELLALCLKQTGLELPVVVVDYLYHDSKMQIGETVETRGAWDEWQWDTLRFFDGAEPWDAYRILENLCRRRTGILRMAEGKWWFIRIPDYRITPYIVAWQYDKDGLNGTSFEWHQTKTIELSPDMSNVNNQTVLKGFDAHRKNWNPSVKRVQHRINYGHFRNQILGTIFDGSLNYLYSVTSTGGDIQALDGPGALALKQFKFLLADSGNIDALPRGIPYSHNNINFSSFGEKDQVDGRHAIIDSRVTFVEIAVKKTELVRVSVQVKNYDLKGGRIAIVAYPYAGLPTDLDTVTPASKSVESFNKRRFLDETGQWSKKPTAINIENTKQAEISGNEVEVSEDEPRTFTVTSIAPYQFGGYIRLYLMPGWALSAPQHDEEDRYVLYDEIALETSQYFKDKKITAHEIRVENTANEFGENEEADIEIGETLNTLNYAYPVGIDNSALGLSSGQWFEYASFGDTAGFRSQNEWAAYSELKMRQTLQMIIQGVIRGDSFGAHYLFKFANGGPEFDGRLFICLSYDLDSYRSKTDIVLHEWLTGPVEVTISRKATTGTESTPLGSGSTFENWYSAPSGGVNPESKGGRIGVPEAGSGGGAPNTIGQVSNSEEIESINEKLADIDNTETVIAGEDLDCSVRPQFVQLLDGNIIIRARDIVHGVILESVTAGQTVVMHLPNYKVEGIADLKTGTLYALEPSNNTIVVWNEVVTTLLPLGLALEGEKLYFVDRWFPFQEQLFIPDLKYLFCDNEAADDEFEPDLDYLFCDNETAAEDFVPLLSQLYCDANFKPDPDDPPVIETEHSRKVLLHNPVELNWGNTAAALPWIEKARYGGVGYFTVLIDWWEIETGYNRYDFTELARRLDFLISQKLKFVIQLPRRYSAIDIPDEEANNGRSSAYLGLANAILLRSGNRAKNGITGTTGSIFDTGTGGYVDRLRKLTARIAHFIYSNKTYRDNCGPGLFINGGSEETGFFTGLDSSNFDDGDYSIAAIEAFRVWLLLKYGSIGDLNTYWTGSFASFDAINPTDYRPYIDGSVIYYNSNRRTRDWFNFLCEKHMLFFGQIKSAWRSPRSADSTLPVFSDGTTDTKFQLAAYWTENLNAAQAWSWGAGAVSMLSPFDVIFSSSGSGDGPLIPRTGGNRFISYAYRMATLRAMGKVFGQEMDLDDLTENGGRIGPSRLARTIFPQGPEWIIYVFYDTSDKWEGGSYRGIDGTDRSFKEDARLAYTTYVVNKERSLPNVTGTLEYSLENILDSVDNPNGVVDSWSTATGADSNGLSSTYINVKMLPIPIP